MKRFAIIIMTCALLVGCVATVTRTELDAAVAAHDHETVNSVSYAGSKDGYHYLIHGYTLGSTAYRIPESEFVIYNPFPLTKDESKWRPLKHNWEMWKPKHLIIGSQQGGPGYPPQGVGSPDP